MVVKDLFETEVKQEILDRINMLRPASQRKWGKMDVAQMMAHCQMPLGVAIGKHKLKKNLVLSLIGPFFKSQLYNDKPFKQNLPTDKSFKIPEQRNFENEKGKLVEMITIFSPETMVDEPHPFFGRLTKEQWSKGSWKHLDHHLQQFGV